MKNAFLQVESAWAWERRRNWLTLLLLLCACVYAAQRLGLSPGRIPEGLARLGWLAGLMTPPQHQGYLPDFLRAIGETLAIAFLGTGLACVVSFPLSFLAASNVTRFPLIRIAVRRSLDVVRGVDMLIWALIFVSALGLGPFAGVLAVMCADVGILARLFADALENVDEGPSEALRGAGATALEIVRFGVLPQVLPVLVSHALYFLESNTRSASILGIVGGGGIGLIQSDRIRANEWQQTSFVLLLILLTVTVLDRISALIRDRFLHAEPQEGAIVFD